MTRQEMRKLTKAQPSRLKDYPKAYIEAVTALRQLLDETELQPIETAPRDGTPVLIFEGDIVAAASWEGPLYQDENFGWTDGSVASWGYQEVVVYHPTHWMPIPEGPKEGE